MSITAPDPGASSPTQLREEAHHWLLRLTSGHATHADAEAFRRWCAQSTDHARAFSQARQLWQTVGPAEQALRADTVAVLPQVRAGHSASPRRMGRRAFLGGALAASVAMVIVARPTLYDGVFGLGADYYTGVGEQRRVEVADGVVLELNTQTRISQRNTAEGARLEILDGEVEVQARTPVRVMAGNGELLADNALFAVRATSGSVCVTCLEGSLQVQHQGSQMALEAGQQLIYTARQQGQPSVVDPTVVMAWRKQMLVFNDAPLATVIDEINRYRPGMIVLMNQQLGQRKVQVRFNLDQLANVAQLIRDAYGVTITELPGGVVLVS